ncbi:helix-turn-helix domain-containing protein [Actinomycetospora corticicola]|uniref:Transcriptional regulator with XRE-family HTH domain n=1 Tax=Actinomycetospora corticicola TaxID=663602 RepID=A0A7Y9DVW1_9PSEU|nr:helix-turn-helix transcriptional regulator [Actinomycetospora corticicola]NYD36359.1 transcriptional regulator with XRE-family HTH domain [Actinomycetospora corticicola]
MALLLREAIGGTIRRARTERRRTLRDVSRDARVSLGYLSEIERGRKEPSSELLAAICEALALPLPDLLDDVAATMRPAPAEARRPARLAERRLAVDPALRSAVEEAFEGAPAEGGEAAAAEPPAAEVVDLVETVDGVDATTDEAAEDEPTGELRLVELVTLGRTDTVRSAA